MEFLPCEMRSIFLWGEVHSIRAKAIPLGHANEERSVFHWGLNPPIPKFPNPSIPELLFLFQIINVTASKISLSRQLDLLVCRDV
jgi:hypothetical protein